MASPCGEPAPPNPQFPAEPDLLWFQDTTHAQFDATVAVIGDPGAERVRVAHLDTGYDPAHLTLPAHLDLALQRNFVEADRPDDATDITEGPLNSLGHGTGTLGILAGKALPGEEAIGAAPFVAVVPIRVANNVVLFLNSAIARAFDYVHQLCANPDTQVHVLTMSMGGVASQAWADAVNALYDAGVFITTAAGNNYGNLPTHNIVFPARFRRVVAACGVMANGAAYANLDPSLMAGNYGPPSKMATAMAAFTPNVPWARIGCSDTINYDGAGTSSATPQVAAAAATWIQQHRAELEAYPEPWMRVEATRKALFESAHDTSRELLGWGELRAREALDQAPAPSDSLNRQPLDAAAFPILRLFFGQGLAAPDRRQRMLELEALQLSQSAALEQILPDPAVDPATLSQADLVRVANALAEHPGASETLRQEIRRSLPQVHAVELPIRVSNPVRRRQLEHARAPEIPPPTRRRLRVYAYDPSLGTHLETLGINEATLDVTWEADLQPGPVGEYLEVIDVDPASQCCYAPVDLNHPYLLVQDGLGPSEANPQFHQQMAYAVAMKTIEHFERALGRVALWSPRLIGGAGGSRREQYVQRLRIYPHAIRAANAYYSPDRKALLLGYFAASTADSADVLPGGLVFGALSHDIIAHETTHALLDGLHRRFREATNLDVLAFHEAFADIVALFQHFSLPEALRQQIARTRGDLSQENLLAQLAVEFGHATGRYGALRDAIGKTEGQQWVPNKPTRNDYQNATEAHDRGAVLVAAVFDAFEQIYRTRTADIIRLATGGSGILPPGAITMDLVERLAREASKVATHVLNICIRALDYCPPVDLTFGDFLRALITADRDLVPEDQRSYRVAFVSAFRERGIYPTEVKSLSVGSLVWEPPPVVLGNVKSLLSSMSLDWDLTVNRRQAYECSRANAGKLHGWLLDRSDDEIQALGFFREGGPMKVGDVEGQLGGIEVHSVRPARRVGPDGQLLADLVVEITQTFRPTPPAVGRFRGGCTLLIDLERSEVRYFVRKRVASAPRLQAQQAFASDTADALRAAYFLDPNRGVEPFAVLHRSY
jgi:hypothetical protein